MTRGGKRHTGLHSGRASQGPRGACVPLSRVRVAEPLRPARVSEPHREPGPF